MSVVVLRREISDTGSGMNTGGSPPKVARAEHDAHPHPNTAEGTDGMIDRFILAITPASNGHNKDAGPVLPAHPGEEARVVPEAIAGMLPIHMHARDLNRTQQSDPQGVRK